MFSKDTNFHPPLGIRNYRRLLFQDFSLDSVIFVEQFIFIIQKCEKNNLGCKQQLINEDGSKRRNAAI